MGIFHQIANLFSTPSIRTELDLSQLILMGTFEGIKVGVPTESLFTSTGQIDFSSNTPVTMELVFNNGTINFKIYTLSNKILGLTYSFASNNKSDVILNYEQIKIGLNTKTKLEELQHYLNRCSIGFTETIPLFYEKFIEIESSKTRLYFDSRSNLSRIELFDWDLYEENKDHL